MMMMSAKTLRGANLNLMPLLLSPLLPTKKLLMLLYVESRPRDEIGSGLLLYYDTTTSINTSQSQSQSPCENMYTLLGCAECKKVVLHSASFLTDGGGITSQFAVCLVGKGIMIMHTFTSLVRHTSVPHWPFLFSGVL
jgi:hypothetical protein